MSDTLAVDLDPGLPAPVRKYLAGFQDTLHINGSWVGGAGGQRFDVFNPATGALLATAVEADTTDVDRAVAAARAALHGPWRALRPRDRGKILSRWAGLIEAELDDLAQLETYDSGMTIQTARGMISDVLETIAFFVAGTEALAGDAPQTDPTSFRYTLRDPIGVCAAITPWNAPITNAVWKIGPALAAGNTLLLKPAEQTPLSTLRLAQLLQDAGLPDGVLNIITGGPAAGRALVEHAGIDKVSFTGSTEVGKQILAGASGNLKHVSLELGGKSANIVFADADLDVAVPTTLAGFTALAGQICIAGSRVFVQQKIYDEFTERLSALTSAVAVGDPMDPTTSVGPLSSKEQLARVSGYLALGLEEGATVSAGGTAVGGNGYFVRPTIFSGARNDMRIAQEEIFGPVAALIPFSDVDDAVRQANDTTYGLAAAMWTTNLSTAHTVARQLDAGTVWINTWGALDPTMPFGGYKQSGIGREFGSTWYHEYTEQKSVYVSL
jgi:acyl-CoA reductase-like NAD-dependent aldehyde dehydrogenase